MIKLNSKIIFLLFFCLFLISTYFYKDYGISLDEKFNRQYGIVNFKYILDFFNLAYPKNVDLSNILNLEGYFDNFYGAFFEIFNFIFVEIILNKKETNEIFHLRHLINHTFFLISLFSYYLILEDIFKNKIYSLLGVFFVYTSPRIFADSFYNGKDIIFLSFFIITFFFGIKLFKKINLKYIIFFSLFSALSINLRFVAIYLPFLFCIFLILDDKFKIKYFFLIFFLTIFFYYIITPFLWTNTLQNLYVIFSHSINFERMENFHTLFLGKQTKIQYLPDSYLPIIFFATSPIFLSCLGIIGFFFILQNVLKNLLNLDKSKLNNNLWKNDKEFKLLFCFTTLFIPIFFYYVFDSIIYSGWRHFFFLYPFFVIFALNVFLKISDKLKGNIIFIIIIILPLLENLNSLRKFHPYEFTFFNILFEKKANELFDIDYWGVANLYYLKKIIKSNPEKKIIKVANASLMDLELSSLLLDKTKKEKLIFLGQNYKEADYIISNFIYEVNIKYDNKYSIPKNFIKIDELKVGNIMINQLYKNINK